MQHHLASNAPLTLMTGEPTACYQRWRDGEGVAGGLLLVEFGLECYWDDELPALELTALYYFDGKQLRIAVSGQAMDVPCLPAGALFEHLLASYALLDYRPETPLELLPAFIPKPWGQEIWYTGVERRGICQFGAGGMRVPIPWLLAVLPGHVTGDPATPLVLLKMLDPTPLPVVGDLYFEVHKSKREVYVVTHVDERAYPSGAGRIRLGFDPARITASGDEQQFRADYLNAVQAYERVRRALDDVTDGRDSAALLEAEQQLRLTMDAFTAMREIRRGDVITVPPLYAHSLQHGVKVVEFQTPDYERQILSFAQRVVTQQHWDTAAAVTTMRLDTPPLATLSRLPAATFSRLERIADFPEFEIQRATIKPGEYWQFESGPTYALAIVTDGSLLLGGRRYAADQALLLPAAWRGELACLESAPPLVLLIARPRS